MKNNYINLIFFLAASLFVINSCTKTDDVKSTVTATSLPFIGITFLEPAYVYGFGKTNIFNDIPDVVAIAVDSVVGFPEGYGGHTGKDSVKVYKSDIVDWPDTVAIGGYSLTFQKFNNANFKATVGTNIVIAGAIPNPGPTDLSGTYKRVSNSYLIEIKKVFDGVYVIDNPGGAGVQLLPYLFYNYNDGNGGDKLVFPIQPNPCGEGLMIVGPSAPPYLASSEYAASYPPIITATSPFTMQWRVYEFKSTSPNAVMIDADCQWGPAIRTFVKQ